MQALYRSSIEALQLGSRAFSVSAVAERKVAVLGAAGGIGQPLGLLMKVGFAPIQPYYTLSNSNFAV